MSVLTLIQVKTLTRQFTSGAAYDRRALANSPPRIRTPEIVYRPGTFAGFTVESISPVLRVRRRGNEKSGRSRLVAAVTR